MILNNLNTEKRVDYIIESLKEIRRFMQEHQISNKEILDFQEACSYMKVSDSMLYKLTSSNSIPFTKPNGKKMYFKKIDLDCFMTKNPNKSKNEYNEIANEWLNQNTI